MNFLCSSVVNFHLATENITQLSEKFLKFPKLVLQTILFLSNILYLLQRLESSQRKIIQKFFNVQCCLNVCALIRKTDIYKKYSEWKSALPNTKFATDRSYTEQNRQLFMIK